MTEYTDQQRLDQYQKDMENKRQQLDFARMNFESGEVIYERNKIYEEAKDKVKELRNKLGIEEKLE